MRKWLLLAGLFAASLMPLKADDLPKRVFPIASVDDTWNLLPRKTAPLPLWARTLINPLPKTTAAMLELDRVHRASNPLGPVLSAKIRWHVADEMKCDYAKKTAETDLARTGWVPSQIAAFSSGKEKVTPEEELAYKFARKMTKAAYTITDAEFAEVLKAFGPVKTSAIVHSVAYANFHNRILLAFQVRPEPVPVPPFDVPLDQDAIRLAKSPARPDWATLKDVAVKVPEKFTWPGEDPQNPVDILEGLANQKARKCRIPLPDKAQFAKLPPPQRRQAETIVWMTVSTGYVPQMTEAWFNGLSAYQSEGRMDRIFTNSLFWIVTRTNECFY